MFSITAPPFCLEVSLLTTLPVFIQKNHYPLPTFDVQSIAFFFRKKNVSKAKDLGRYFSLT